MTPDLALSSPNYHTTPMGGRLSFDRFLACIKSSTRQDFNLRLDKASHEFVTMIILLSRPRIKEGKQKLQLKNSSSFERLVADNPFLRFFFIECRFRFQHSCVVRRLFESANTTYAPSARSGPCGHVAFYNTETSPW
ncbi:hypothetical protein TNCV_931811 [Trichonephila clavipes]|nr:hypothetical protein TNCV_931811 [Trichonephila clavipes]